MIDNRIFITLLLFLVLIPIGFSAYEVTQCLEITEPGEYYLVQDIYAQDSNYCFRIWSGDVVLDCRGHSIIGPGFAAIEISVGSNIVVRNCNVVDWSNSLISNYISNVTILNSTFTSHVHLGDASNCYLSGLSFYTGAWLELWRYNNCVLENLYFTGRDSFLYIYRSDNTIVKNVRMEEAGYIDIDSSQEVNIMNVYIKTIDFVTPSISIYACEYVNVTNVELYGTGSGSAMDIMYSVYINITNVTIANYDVGIEISRYSEGNSFGKITITNVTTGIDVYKDVHQNYFGRIAIKNASYAGILVRVYRGISPFDNIFEDFSISDSLNGIVVKGIDGSNEFRRGVIENVMGNGIHLEDSSGQKFHGIKIKNASGCGVYLYSSGGNLFYNNMFLNRNNTCFSGDIYANYWNTTLTKAKNIVGGPFIGGNFWGDPDGKPILEKLGFAVKNGIYEGVYDLLGDGTNVDYLPLAFVPLVVPKPFSLVGLFVSIAELNPFVVVLVLLIPLILALFLIKEFREMRVDKPLDLVLKFIAIIIALVLLAEII